MNRTYVVLDADFEWLLSAPAAAWLFRLVNYGTGRRAAHGITAVLRINVDAPK
jgi:hypothetical protein